MFSLGRLKADEAASLIGKCLGSDDENLRVMSANALRTLSRRTAVPALTSALRNEDPVAPNNDAARAIIHALGWLQAHVAMDEILRFSRSPDRLVRSSVVGALGRIGVAEVIPPLASALGDADGAVGREAERALRRIGSPEALAELEKAGR